MTIYSGAILQIGQKIIGSGQINLQEILNVLGETLNNTRITLWEIANSSCKIVAGIPEGAHGIGKTDPLVKHEDIEWIVTSELEHFFDDSPATNPRTHYFLLKIQEEGINAILYVKIKMKNICSIIVVDAIGSRIAFPFDEVRHCKDFGKLLVARIISYEEFLFIFCELIKDSSFQELRDQYFKDFLATVGHLKRLIRNIKGLVRDRGDDEQVSIKTLKDILHEAEEVDRCASEFTERIPLTI